MGYDILQNCHLCISPLGYDILQNCHLCISMLGYHNDNVLGEASQLAYKRLDNIASHKIYYHKQKCNENILPFITENVLGLSIGQTSVGH